MLHCRKRGKMRPLTNPRAKFIRRGFSPLDNRF